MRSRKLIVALAAVVLVSGCGASDEQGASVSDVEPAVVADTAREPANDEQWRPVIYQAESSIQPTNDLQTFFFAFLRNQQGLLKGEFEKTHDYEERLLKRESFGDFDPEAIYPVTQSLATSLTYDADREVYTTSPNSPYCGSSLFGRDVTACLVGYAEDETGSSTDRQSFWDFFYLPNEPMADRSFEHPKHRGSSPPSLMAKYFKSTCIVPIDVAKTAKGDVELSYLIKVSSSKLLYAGAQFQDAIGLDRPSVSSPIAIRASIVGMMCTDGNDRVLYKEIF